MFNRLVFGQSHWALWLTVFGVMLAVLVIYGYRRARLPGPTKFLSITLKLTALGAILFALLDPMLAVQRPQLHANRVAIVLDQSLSMQSLISDRGDSTPAAVPSQDWQERLSSRADWQQALENDFRVRRYRFGSRLEAVDGFDSTSLTDTSSTTTRSLELLTERLQGVPTAGVVLISDGQVTTHAGSEDDKSPFDPAKLGFPVYPVDLGTIRPEPDLGIKEVVLRQSNFEAAPVTITAKLEAVSFGGKKAEVKLLDSQSNVVEKKLLDLEGDRLVKPVEFRFRPDGSGIRIYRLVVSIVDSSPSSTVERILLNNERTIVVDRGHGPYKILYIAGRPNWEHKFLQRALSEDAEIRMTSLIRIANKEPKFSFRDTKVDAANPLFAGFEDVSDEEKEQYNEPVFVRIGVEDAGRHLKGFPKSADELFEYRAVIIDDIEHDFFSADQQSLLRRFVSIRGGSLLYLAGTESMRGRGLRESILAQILPVYGEDFSEASRGKFGKEPPLARYQLTREGWLESFLRVADNETDERKQAQAMPPLRVLNQAGGLKPGAVVLSEVRLGDEDSRAAAMVAQRFGKGKSAVLLVGDMWRWGLHHEKEDQPPLYRAWRQMVRWLIADVPQPISMEVQPAQESPGGRAATISVTAKSIQFEPQDDVTVQINVVKPDGTKLSGRAEPSDKQAGVFEFPLLTLQEGGYQAIAEVTDAAGVAVGDCRAGWVHEPSVRELESLGSNRKFLDKLARSTGGEVLTPGDLATLAERFHRKPVPVMEIEWRPLWNNGWMMAVVLGCLAGEWWLRRKNGLP